MPRIHFTSSPKIPRDKVNEWGDYKIGSVHNISDNEAERWLRRGVAEIVSPRRAAVINKEEEQAEEEARIKAEEIQKETMEKAQADAKARARAEEEAKKVAEATKTQPQPQPTTPTSGTVQGDTTTKTTGPRNLGS